MNKKYSTLLSITLAFVSFSAAGAAESVPSAVRACADLADAQARLACYDREIAPFLNPSPDESSGRSAVTGSPGAANPPPHASPAAAPTTEADDTEFGMTPQLSEKANPGAGAEPDEKEELKAVVSEIRKTANRALIVTLDNGQIWQQKYASSSFRLQEGDAVTITKGNFGGYSMVGTRSRRNTQVRRVQ